MCLVPAATENQITSQNADRIKCKVLAGRANGPTTAAADQVLHEKGIFVIPDILANAGWGDGFILRMGTGQDGLLLAGRRSQPASFRTPWLPASTISAGMPMPTRSTLVPRPTCWP